MYIGHSLQGSWQSLSNSRKQIGTTFNPCALLHKCRHPMVHNELKVTCYIKSRSEHQSQDSNVFTKDGDLFMNCPLLQLYLIANWTFRKGSLEK